MDRPHCGRCSWDLGRDHAEFLLTLSQLIFTTLLGRCCFYWPHFMVKEAKTQRCDTCPRYTT